MAPPLALTRQAVDRHANVLQLGEDAREQVGHVDQDVQRRRPSYAVAASSMAPAYSSRSRTSAIRARVIGWVHTFATTIYQERVFSGLSATIFEEFKLDVDELLAARAGDALNRLPAVSVRLSEGDPESFSQALLTCRRILDTLADQVFPPTNGARSRRDGHRSVQRSRGRYRVTSWGTVWAYYSGLLWKAVWQSAGLWSRGWFLTLLVLALVGLAIPAIALLIPSVDAVPRWAAVVPLAILAVWDVLRTNHATVADLLSKVQALQAQVQDLQRGPALEFGLDEQWRPTRFPALDQRIMLGAEPDAHWYRIRVRNCGPTAAYGCTLRVEGISGTANVIVPGPLAVTSTSEQHTDIASDDIVRFDLGWCYENLNPPLVFLSTVPKFQQVESYHGRLDVSVRFTELQTRQAHTGVYRFNWDGSRVWVEGVPGFGLAS